MARHAPDEVTEALDQLVDQLGETAIEGQFASGAALRALKASEW